ncbi:hypothetical protein CGRA01v4_08610 [Colletotrichum graminicola]|uniref:Secreted protein n=1 Tax=Colletotrichum graminicola (strain M1.001 / M2 / FGSC 10212) TaxID=645133 RepID=E3QJC5_COLGM|nr:uncharacterized protein GLRG_06107 [Colletotrichum graminicola M1.001]EFQ30963.1 hypothetical protein GLRG_06107 [Colletotrichum graminicola M1.001]WDK17327.1 hypothetical protein CGRA01v4_08610 [Colletotrichum graminicola]
MAAIIFAWPVGWFFLLVRPVLLPRPVTVTAHTTSILLLDEGKPYGSRPTTGATLGCQRRISFGLGCNMRTLVFWFVDWSMSEILRILLRTLRSLAHGIHSFAPDKRTVLPSPWTSPELAY